jgi:hypothetical protein
MSSPGVAEILTLPASSQGKTVNGMMAMRLLACLLVLPRAGAELVLLDAPPSGFNTFDAYGYAWLNASGVEDLLRTFAQSPLKTQASS